MEHLILTQRDAIERNATIASLKTKGVFMAPFNSINSKLEDMLNYYVKHSVSYNTFRKLSKINYSVQDTDVTYLNIFTDEKYTDFLRFICLEDFKDTKSHHRTLDFKILLGDCVDSTMLPIVRNDNKSRKLFDKISSSEYKIFHPDTLWVVLLVTELFDDSVKKTVAEVNIFIPTKLILY